VTSRSADDLQSSVGGFSKSLSEETAMQNLLTVVSAIVAVLATFSVQSLPRSELVLVRAVIDGDTIDVTTFGRVRLLGIDAPEIGRVFDTPAPFAYAAKDKLASLVLHRWVRLESDGERMDMYKRRLAYVVTEDDVCVNVVLVREGLARVTARVPLVRLDELKRAEAEAQSFRKGLWGAAPSAQSPGYTRRSPNTHKRRSSWPRFPSSTHHSARFANATSFTIGSTTGRSGSSSFSSRPVR
jgi:endonuclease YncB( thermonuclease family)